MVSTYYGRRIDGTPREWFRLGTNFVIVRFVGCMEELYMGQKLFVYCFALAVSLLLSPPGHAGNNLIAYIGGEGALYTIQPDGSGKRKLASGELLQTIAFSPQRIQNGQDFYSWPVWSPDGSRLACFHIVTAEAGQTDGLYIFDVANAQVLHSYKAQGLQPIYAYWAPNSKQLAILLGGGGPLSLGLWPTTDGKQPKAIAQGVPFYFDWRADAQALLMHVGGDTEAKEGHSVSLFDVVSGKRTMVSRSPSVFGPPSWSHDGRWLAYGDTAKDQEKTVLMVAAADGATPKSFGTFPARITMEWSPTQPLLAVASSSFPGDPLIENLQLVDIASGKTRQLVKGNFAAYFWSPDGKHILYARRKPNSLLWTWSVVDVEDSKIHEIADFIPSRPLLLVFQYFDQYALSHRLWSPDSKHFVFAGSAGSELHPAVAAQNPSVYVVEAKDKASPQSVSDGHIAFWSLQ
jgi:TolB protein